MNPMDMLKNFQDIQAKMSETQEKLRGVTAVGTAGGDMVRVEFNGHMEVRSVKISPEAVDPAGLICLLGCSVLRKRFGKSFSSPTAKRKQL
ncbi:MAG: YbaB/EbfC family nucleoid-associated protein [Spirochaeta sp.]|nr:YbaB/EbfC family nucleoid-associated protein [Spirochaeta sp.]